MLKFSATLIATLTLLTLPPAVAYSCQPGNPNSLAYIRRDNNRCEGINDRPISGSNTFDLVSFTTTNLTNYPDNLAIRVPGTGRSRPEIVVQSYYRNYRLDNVLMRMGEASHTFSLNTTVLRRAAIPPNLLQATATINRNGQLIHYPVVLGQSSGQYVFTLASSRRTTFPTVEIRRHGQRVFQNPITTPRSGPIPITWSYGNAPSGLYELYVVDGTGQRRLFRFEHHQSWF